MRHWNKTPKSHVSPWREVQSYVNKTDLQKILVPFQQHLKTPHTKEYDEYIKMEKAIEELESESGAAFLKVNRQYVV